MCSDGYKRGQLRPGHLRDRSWSLGKGRRICLFPQNSRPAVRPNNPSLPWISGAFSHWLVGEAVRSPPYSTKDKNSGTAAPVFIGRNWVIPAFGNLYHCHRRNVAGNIGGRGQNRRWVLGTLICTGG